MDHNSSELRAKIVATIGPASRDPQTIEALLVAGVDVARLNFSHGTHTEHAEVIQSLREISLRLGRPVCILQDLQGPKIRTGELTSGQVKLDPGQPFILTTEPVPGDNKKVHVDFAGLPGSVQPGGRILLDDGNLELCVQAVNGNDVETRVVTGGLLKPHKGVNLPGAKLNISAMTEKDEVDLEFGLRQGVDAVALSFVRTPEDVRILRETIGRLSSRQIQIPIITKLEKPEALDNLDGIVCASNGVMVARGDLGVEMSPEEVTIAQKRIIECANRHGRVVITATQMLESMINNPRPTRAEASDVANAILDGTDAVMLSGETASGNYPVKAVQMMHAIIFQAEAHQKQWGHWQGVCEPEFPDDDTYYMTMAARELAYDRNVSAIAVFTLSGRTALFMAKTRPGVPVLAFTPLPEIYHRMSLYWGVKPLLVPHASNIETMLHDVEAAMMASSSVKAGQQVVLICGFPVGELRPTNLALLYTVGRSVG